MKSNRQETILNDKSQKKKKIAIIIITILFIVIIAIGISFAYLRVTKIQSVSNKIASQCLDVTFEEDLSTEIHLDNVDSLSDKEGQKTSPYKFTITNNCPDSINYVINLDILKDLSDSSSLQLNHVKVSLNGNTASLLSSYDDTNKTVSSAYSSKELYVGKLKGNKTVTYKLRLWVDENTPTNEGINKLFSSKIIITSTVRKVDDGDDDDDDNATTTLASYITNLADEDSSNLVYDGTDDDNLRYIGKDPSNYLCLDSDCTNGKWRVIGIMDNIETESNGTQSLVKIVTADSLGLYVWNYTPINDWSTATLKDNLNSGELYETYIKAYDDLFESVTWNLGGSPNNTGVYTKEFYTYERGTTVYSGHATEWTGKIALMYPSDYGYATSGGDTKNRDACLSTSLYDWYNVSDCYENDYLYLPDSTYNQWTITPLSSNVHDVFQVLKGSGTHDLGSADCTYGTRPAGYLKSNVIISSGDGTSDNPWIITSGKDAN